MLADGGCGRGKALIVLAICLVLGSCSVANSDVELSAVEPVAFAVRARSARDVLLDSDYVVIRTSMVELTPGDGGDYRHEYVLRIDRPARRSRQEHRSSRTDGYMTGDSVMVFDGPDVYISKEIVPTFSSVWLERTRIEYVRAVRVIDDPIKLARRMIDMLDVSDPVEIGGVGGDTVRAVVPHSALFWYLPASYMFVFREHLGIDPDRLTGSSEVLLRFNDGALTTVEAHFGAFLDDAGLPESALNGFLTATTSFLYPKNAPIELPPSDRVGPPEPTEPLESTYVSGECYRRNVGPTGPPDLAVPCTKPHGSEVYEVRRLSDPLRDPFPGTDEVVARSTEICAESFRRIFGVPLEHSVYPSGYLHPIEESWPWGDRSVVCFIRFDEEVQVPLAELDLLRSSDAVSIHALRTGDCITDGSLDGLAYSLVDCASPHFSEVYHAFELPDGDFPGEANTARLADEACLRAFESAIGEPYASSDWTIVPQSPNASSWDEIDDRLVACLITMYGPVEGSAIVPGN